MSRRQEEARTEKENVKDNLYERKQFILKAPIVEPDGSASG